MLPWRSVALEHGATHTHTHTQTHTHHIHTYTCYNLDEVLYCVLARVYVCLQVPD
jgi:hypothetical protein